MSGLAMAQIRSQEFDPPAELMSFLADQGAHERAHSGRALADHLAGTYRLLKAWGCHDDVCSAGLFHSIYGTSRYSDACVSMGQRVEISNKIGDYAEQLVYLFYLADRPRSFIEASSTHVIRSRFDAVKTPITPRQARDLMAVECANLAEQGDDSLSNAILRLGNRGASSLLGSKIAPNVFKYYNQTRGNGNA